MSHVIINTFATANASWLVTGAAGFIGSNIVEYLLLNGQTVTGLDNFVTGSRSNIESVRMSVDEKSWSRFTLIDGDIRDPKVCQRACRGVHYVLHQAALGSVPYSIEDPTTANSVNVDGFINMLVAAKEEKVKRVVYASSSAVYGDDPALPKSESQVGKPLSPYAATKRANELYADSFGACYGLEIIGLRYFNVFGPRQDPNGAYAAVIPKWFEAMLTDQEVRINGDGETSRDFCFVEDVVQANLLSALTRHPLAVGKFYNVACGHRTTLNELFFLIRDLVAEHVEEAATTLPVHGQERHGDIRHSVADISLAREFLGFTPEFKVKVGLQKAAGWYLDKFSSGGQEVGRMASAASAVALG